VVARPETHSVRIAEPVPSRAAATLYATQHGLVGAFEPAELAAV